MDTITIVLIVVIVILVFFLIRTNKASSSVSKATVLNLNNSNTPITSTSSFITNSSSTRFSYESWICVNTWNNTITKDIYYANTTTTDPVFKLSLAASSPTLTCTIKTATSTYTPIVVTKNFPIQKWVYVVISVDNTVVDCYLDGKLLTSQQLPNVPYVTDAYGINFGVFDAYLTGFVRNAFPLDPQTVWNKYMSGNGVSKSGSSYGVTAAITKDGSDYSTLF
jgi:hypothetical protein